jgi:hypothetical protein
LSILVRSRSISFLYISDSIDFPLDTEIQDSSDSAITLSQAMVSRQQLLLADVEQACQKFEAALS